MNDTERMNWLNSFLTYEHMLAIFGEDIGLASDGGPRDIRAAIDMAAEQTNGRQS